MGDEGGAKSTMPDAAKEIRWRIHTSDDVWRRQRLQWQIWLAVAASLIVVVFVLPESLRLEGGLVVVGLTAAVFAVQWVLLRSGSRDAMPNARLAADGFHWQADESNDWQQFPRESLTGFRLTPEQDGHPWELSFVLAADLESQPIGIADRELAEMIRDWLLAHWSLEEIPGPAAPLPIVATHRLPVYFECHPENHTWHWEGDAAGYQILGQHLRDAGESLPLPPPGVRPKMMELIGTRREPSEMLIAHDRQAWITADTVAGPTEFLQRLANFLEEITQPEAEGDHTWPPEESGLRWTIIAHVRGAQPKLE
jgi:hypothetical protein